jgi:hypothetical protein
MQQNYYENEYGKIQDTKEINQAARDRRKERESEREREAEEPNTGNDVGTLQPVCQGNESEPDNSNRLGGGESSGSKKDEGTATYDARLRSILFQE